MAEKSYDTEEAVQLVSLTADRVVPDKKGRSDATRKLLDEIAGLDGRAGLRAGWVDEEPRGVGISFRNGRSLVLVAHEEGVRIMRPGGRFVADVQLDHDRVAQCLVGKDADTAVALAPGQRPPRKNALSVVMASALHELEQLTKG